MNLAAIMTKDPVTVLQDESVGDAAAKLVLHRLTGLPVVDSEGRYLGLFGLYDFLALLLPRVALAGDLMSNLRFMNEDTEELRRRYRDISGLPVSQFVNHNVPTLDPDTAEVDALRLFCRNQLSLPVVHENSRNVQGIVSCWDAIRAITNSC